MSHPLRFASFVSELWLLLCCSISGYSRTCREACGGGVFWSPFGPNLRFETASTQHGTARNGVFFFWPIEDGRQQTSQSGGPLRKHRKKKSWVAQSSGKPRVNWMCSLAECAGLPTLGSTRLPNCSEVFRKRPASLTVSHLVSLPVSLSQIPVLEFIEVTRKNHTGWERQPNS